MSPARAKPRKPTQRPAKKPALSARRTAAKRPARAAEQARKRPPRANAKLLDLKDDTLKAWVVTADMGLGHQRAAYPLRSIAKSGIMTLGKAADTPPEEHKLWVRMRKNYEFLSRTKNWPVVGNMLFSLLDRIQNIPPFYPIRDMSSPSFQVMWLKSYIEKGMCMGMMERIRQTPLPLITTYFAPAIAADMAGYSRVYCILCDAEINRAWVAENPRRSKIVYLAPCGRTVRRLHQYGVPDERIWLTGFPFPIELLGDHNLNVLKWDAAQRLFYLDPMNRFWPLHGRNVTHFLGPQNCRFAKDRVLTITFGVGGAGAQTDIAYAVARSLRDKIAKGTIQYNVLAGIRPEVNEFLQKMKKDLGCPSINIVFGRSLEEYFKNFTECMRVTDILWTKPSELSFYCGLGIPVVIAPPIGSQEKYNQSWLLEIQAGYPQEDPQYADQWLFDLLNAGRLADAAWDGFLKARKYGTYKIYEILQNGAMERETSVLRR
jgi:hypothetical protein